MNAPFVEAGLFALAIAASVGLARVNRLLTIPVLLVAGVALGPHQAGLLSNAQFLGAASDIGLVLLLFFTSLFSPPSALRQGGRIALPLAAYDLLLNFAVAYWIGAVFDWDLQSRLLLAGVLMTSSTVAVFKVLADEGRLLRREGSVLIALVGFEDLAFVGFFLFVTGRQHWTGPPQDVLGGLLLFGLFLGLLYLLRGVVWKVRRLEILVPLVTSVGLLGAWLGTLGGIPAAGAAFSTGMLLAGRRGPTFIQTEAPYLREVAAAAFFLAFGAGIDPGLAPQILPVAALALLGIIVTELAFLPLVGRLLGLGRSEALVVGTSLLARGAKSASYAQLGAQAGNARHAGELQGIAGALALVLTPVTPFLVRFVLWLRRDERIYLPAWRTREVLSQITRRVLAPTEYGQRHLASVWARLGLGAALILPGILAVVATFLEGADRWALLAAGTLALAPAFLAARRYFARAPTLPTMTYRTRRRALPRVEDTLPVLLVGPAALALAFVATGAQAATAFPGIVAAALLLVWILPRLVHARPVAPAWGDPWPVRRRRGAVPVP